MAQCDRICEVDKDNRCSSKANLNCVPPRSDIIDHKILSWISELLTHHCDLWEEESVFQRNVGATVWCSRHVDMEHVAVTGVGLKTAGGHYLLFNSLAPLESYLSTCSEKEDAVDKSRAKL